MIEEILTELRCFDPKRLSASSVRIDDVLVIGIRI